MATLFSLIPDVLDGIVTGLRASTGFRGPDDSADGVTVYDGPEWTGQQAEDRDGFLIVGYGGEDLESRKPEEGATSVTGESQVRSISTSAYKEQSDEIPCVLYAWSGDLSFSALRTSAFAVVDAVEQWLTDNPRCGVAAGAHNEQVLWATATGTHELRQYRDGGKSVVVIPFTITVRTRT